MDKKLTTFYALTREELAAMSEKSEPPKPPIGDPPRPAKAIIAAVLCVVLVGGAAGGIALARSGNKAPVQTSETTAAAATNEPESELSETTIITSEPKRDFGDIIESGECGYGVTWTQYSDGTLQISGQGIISKFHPDNTLPRYVDLSKYGLEPDSEIVDKINKVSSLVIDEGISEIEEEQFLNYKYMKNVELPEGMKRIGAFAFFNCSNLKAVTIPKSVTLINEQAFGYYSPYMKAPWKGISSIQTNYNKYSGFKIYCYKDTAGERYAKENGFDYELIG